MDVAALLLELYGRVPPLAREAVDGVDVTDLTKSPAPGTNPIAWLVWHATRVQDHHVSELLDTEQIWISGDWARGSGSSPNRTTRDMGTRRPTSWRFLPSGAALLDYLDAVDGRTREHARTR